MNTILKYSLLALAVLALLFFGVGYFLPAKSAVQQKQTFLARPMDIFALINYLPNWTRWDHLYEQDKSATRMFDTPTSGRGAIFRWTSDHISDGKVTIVNAKAPEFIEIQMDYDSKDTELHRFDLKDLGENGTEVLWTVETNHGTSLMDRWAGLFNGELGASVYAASLE